MLLLSCDSRCDVLRCAVLCIVLCIRSCRASGVSARLRCGEMLFLRQTISRALLLRAAQLSAPRHSAACRYTGCARSLMPMLRVFDGKPVAALAAAPPVAAPAKTKPSRKRTRFVARDVGEGAAAAAAAEEDRCRRARARSCAVFVYVVVAHAEVPKKVMRKRRKASILPPCVLRPPQSG